MNYRLGVGLLIENDDLNYVRSKQMLLSKANNSNSALLQPPHITIKRPFEIDSFDDINKYIDSIDYIARKFKAFKLTFNDIGEFSGSTLYLSVQDQEELAQMHQSILEDFHRLEGLKAEMHEGKNMIFHSTLAYNLSMKQMNLSKEILGVCAQSLPREISIKTIALLANVDGSHSWNVVSSSKLS